MSGLRHQRTIDLLSKNPPPLYTFLILADILPNRFLMPLCPSSLPKKEAGMADIIYGGLGLLLIALMGAYAHALAHA